MDANIIAALLGVIATLIGVSTPFIADRLGKPSQLQKFVYITVIYLTKRCENRQPVYKKFVSRLGKEIEVFDEYSFFRLNVFKHPQKDFTCTDRSSGVVDLKLLYPWHDTIRFSDKGAQLVENIINYTFQDSSTVYCTQSRYFNGFQPGHEDAAMKMEYSTQEARMVIDFSAIPNHETIFKGKPKGFLRTQSGEELVGITEPSPGVFSISGSKLEKDNVLGIIFDIDWDKL